MGPLDQKIYPEIIAKDHPTAVAACEEAKRLKTNGDDPTAKKCFVYASETIALCKF